MAKRKGKKTYKSYSRSRGRSKRGNSTRRRSSSRGRNNSRPQTIRLVVEQVAPSALDAGGHLQQVSRPKVAVF